MYCSQLNGIVDIRDRPARLELKKLSLLAKPWLGNQTLTIFNNWSLLFFSYKNKSLLLQKLLAFLQEILTFDIRSVPDQVFWTKGRNYHQSSYLAVGLLQQGGGLIDFRSHKC
jgi:hypothetical protein